jgi:multidrug resistance efflux pump
MDQEAKAEPVEQESAPQTTADDKPDRLRRITLIIAGLCLAFFAWYVIADRLTPSTTQARVKAYVVPIVPEVAGLVVAVNVAVNELVAGDQVLVEIDKADFENALDAARAALDEAVQAVGASSAGVKSAAATLSTARAALKIARQDHERLKRVHAADPGAVSESSVQNAAAEEAQAASNVAAAAAELERAKEQLGSAGQDNPKIRGAMAAVEQARFDLDETTLRAPSDGVATNVQIDVGQYAQPGAPILTFISTSDVWVEAYMRENNLGNIKVGDLAWIVLDNAPGRVFDGTVESIAPGVNWDTTIDPVGLPVISQTTGWLREPQRFPVIIKFADDASRGLRRFGAQADVIVFTGDHLVMNFLGRVWARVMSVLSYVY